MQQLSTQYGSTSAQQSHSYIQQHNYTASVLQPKANFSFIPSSFPVYPVHIVDCKHSNWMASVWCCDETMGKWRETRTLQQASCFPPMHPGYSISPSGITGVLLVSPLHTNKAIKWTGSKSNSGAVNCIQHIFPIEVSTNGWMDGKGHSPACKLSKNNHPMNLIVTSVSKVNAFITNLLN